MNRTKYVVSIVLFIFTSLSLIAQERPSSIPFVSGDTFRNYCLHKVDETGISCVPMPVNEGDTIFVKTDYLDYFFNNIHPCITNKYILITHNSDDHAPGQFASYLDDPKIIAWFAQNISPVHHVKLRPIPIGLANRHWPHGNIDTLQTIRSQTRTHHRPFLLYMNFEPSTYPSERGPLYERFIMAPFCYSRLPTSYSTYLGDLALARFVLCPRGNGLDTHRTWEALLMGAIPIVKHSQLDPLFKNLPILLVDDWSEITEHLLNQKWNEFQSNNYDFSSLYFSYWTQLIETIKSQ